MNESTMITRKVLMKETSAPYWTIVHLTLSGRLPLEHASMGKGDPNIYQFEAIKITKEYLIEHLYLKQNMVLYGLTKMVVFIMMVNKSMICYKKMEDL